MHNKKVFIEWDRYPAYRDSSIVKCLNCQQFNHKSTNCENEHVRSKCPANHDEKNCESISFQYTNCKYANHRCKTNYNINHGATDLKCPSLKFIVQIIKTKTDYSIQYKLYN